MDAGTLRERVTVQQATENRNRLGESISEWATFATVWASVDGVSAREYLLAGQQQIDTSPRSQLRYLPGLPPNSTRVLPVPPTGIIPLLQH